MKRITGPSFCRVDALFRRVDGNPRLLIRRARVNVPLVRDTDLSGPESRKIPASRLGQNATQGTTIFGERDSPG
jgi:hypothetical protein